MQDDQRRHPDPVEWALLVEKVVRMGASIEMLTEEFKKFSAVRCSNCENKADIDDHENRLRRLEEYVYKGVAIAAVASPFLYFVLNKVWK